MIIPRFQSIFTRRPLLSLLTASLYGAETQETATGPRDYTRTKIPLVRLLRARHGGRFRKPPAYRFVSHILDGKTGKRRTLPAPIHALSPDARWAVAPVFRRLHDLRRGYGYARIWRSLPTGTAISPARSTGSILCCFRRTDRDCKNLFVLGPSGGPSLARGEILSV